LCASTTPAFGFETLAFEIDEGTAESLAVAGRTLGRAATIIEIGGRGVERDTALAP